jgi:hypothetical protein
MIGNSVRLIAGAVQPSRWDSNWLPRYSAITISVTDDQGVVIRVFPRRWSSEEFSFIGDFNSQGRDYRDYRVPVEAREVQGDH